MLFLNFYQSESFPVPVPLATETFDRKLKAESCTEYFDRSTKEINDSPFTGKTSLYRLLSDFSVCSLEIQISNEIL